jgi:hypothetical protein
MSQERQPYSNVRRVQNRCNAIDTHEVLKQEIYKQGYDYDTNFRFGFNQAPTMGGAPGTPATPTPTMGGPSGPGVGFEDYELHFDTLNKDTSSDLENGEVKWSITSINNSQDIKNCIQIKVGPFFFPKVSNATGNPDYFFYRRVYMQILGLPSTQAILAPNGNQYHFEFEVENLNSIAVRLNPLKDTFFFQRPITSLTEFQVRFMVPHGFKKVALPADKVTLISVNNSNPARFTIVGGELTTEVLGALGATTAPGIAVYISGFTTADTAINNAVNTTEGVYISNIVNSTSFEISGIDLTGIAASNATMVIPKNHIAFPVRFTTVRDQLTNYVSAIHE